ncbi:MAG: serine hydrolase [Cyclobacteriaceae bacterium]|nr:serine hydrolase [Cyclobacteriaceae bacterium]
MKVFFATLFFVLIISIGASAQKDKWVDSVYTNLSPKQRIAQLFMVAAYSGSDVQNQEQLKKLVGDFGIGGLIFFKGKPVQQAQRTNELQNLGRVPLLIAMDAEWGLNMRLDSVQRFPYHITMGAMKDENLIYDAGKSIARQCRRIGVHINFAPVADVNVNPDNPVISFRSFGELPEEVSRKSVLFMKGMQDHGLMAVAKHFPGHGDTHLDSHLDLPSLAHDRQRLETVELLPFTKLIQQGVQGIMTAHLDIPSIDDSGVPVSLSRQAVQGLLKEQMGFNGLVFTDALNMKGVTRDFPSGEIEIRAIEAGNDVLLFSEDVENAISAVSEAIQSGRLTEEMINARCRRILGVKYDFGLYYKPHIDVQGLVNDLNPSEDVHLLEKMAASSLTLLKNENALPIKELEKIKIASVSVGVNEPTYFQKFLNRYVEMPAYVLPKDASDAHLAELWQKLMAYDIIICGIHQMGLYPSGNFGISAGNQVFISQLAGSGRSIISLFGNPYALGLLSGIEQSAGLLIAYQETEITQSTAAQAIFGAIQVEGSLPVSVSRHFSAGMGIRSAPINRLSFGHPASVGIDQKKLLKIDSLALLAIEAKATPGCQILVARSGKVVYYKSFGRHTYEGAREVKENDIYDLASITKVSTALPALMKLYEEGHFDLDAQLGQYLPEFRKINSSGITFREMLTHQAGLTSWIPFWKDTKRKNGRFKWRTFKADSNRRFNTKVTDNLYLHRNYANKIYNKIDKAPLGEKKYLYSDLSFIIYPRVVEKITGMDFQDYLNHNFYHPLGATTLVYNPLDHFPLHRIVPTEYDGLFRETLIHGRVHDEGAAMLRGVSGHAGLFGTSIDLAKMVQMVANEGYYGGKRYLKAETIREFTRCQFCDIGNRRALGYDRPLEKPHQNGNTAVSASQKSFGHSGFTGTFFWVDPEYDLVYIFLSNRVHPTRENTTLYKMNVRTGIQQLIYDAITDH